MMVVQKKKKNRVYSRPGLVCAACPGCRVSGLAMLRSLGLCVIGSLSGLVETISEYVLSKGCDIGGATDIVL